MNEARHFPLAARSRGTRCPPPSRNAISSKENETTSAERTDVDLSEKEHRENFHFHIRSDNLFFRKASICSKSSPIGVGNLAFPGGGRSYLGEPSLEIYGDRPSSQGPRHTERKTAVKSAETVQRGSSLRLARETN
ncbi:hypothetical protein J6590_003448 [Homalodisca vitripennis]|nr:hypothetical protein J6590_003448 [Homalodisca vitripennis]